MTQTVQNPKVGETYKLDGQPVKLVRILPFHPRLTDGNYRVAYVNGAVIDVRKSDLQPAA